jgi:hypothetical protein
MLALMYCWVYIRGDQLIPSLVLRQCLRLELYLDLKCGLIPDGIVGLVSEPVGKGSVLLVLLDQSTLNFHGFDGTLKSLKFAYHSALFC